MLLNKNFLLYILGFPVFGILIILFIPSNEERSLKNVSLIATFLSFIGTLFVWGSFQKLKCSFQFVSTFHWLPLLNLSITFGVDGISLCFLLLTTLLIPICLLVSWNSLKENLKEFLVFFLFLDVLLIGAFCVLDILFFYVFFESVLIPMFLIIGVWGSRNRKILAAYYFFLYTLLGSSVMLLSILYIYLISGTTSYEVLLTFKLLKSEQKILWLTFFTAFAGKVPMMPTHLWLPEAHVEAPTGGSVVLAGILLKLGIYGFLRFSLPLFPEASFFFAPLIYSISIIGIVYGSLTAIRQTDFKRVIAYTSIAHMNLVILGIFCFNSVGLEGAILQSLSHGFVASALFIIIGIIYDRYRTRVVQYYGGLASVMPLYTSIFLFFTLANLSFPGTSSFVGEFMILIGSFKANTTVTILGATSVVLGGAYSLWLLNRIAFGNLKTQYSFYFLDLGLREFAILSPLMIGTLVTGIFPNIFLNYITGSVSNLIEFLYFYGLSR